MPRIGHKVALVVNYDGFRLDETLSDAFFEMVSELQAKYYSAAMRYTTSAFMRMKLGAELSARRQPHMCSRPATRPWSSLRSTLGRL